MNVVELLLKPLLKLSKLLAVTILIALIWLVLFVAEYLLLIICLYFSVNWTSFEGLHRGFLWLLVDCQKFSFYVVDVFGSLFQQILKIVHLGKAFLHLLNFSFEPFKLVLVDDIFDWMSLKIFYGIQFGFYFFVCLFFTSFWNNN